VSFSTLDYWPAVRPHAESCTEGWLVNGWFQPENKARLQELLADSRVRFAVELGAWYGASARFLLEHSGATVFSVDIWDKDLIAQEWQVQCPEFAMHPEMRRLLEDHPIGETFMVNLWEFRERLVPLKMRSVDGLRHVSRLGVMPDLIYVDANHEYRAVVEDIETGFALFPHAKMCGDDYSWFDVKRAVHDLARAHGRTLRTVGEFWEFE
jgi:hypothetical protein